jgi:integrase/recombinase XerC
MARHSTSASDPRAARTGGFGTARRVRRPPALPLAVLVAEFLDEVDQTLAPASLRAYQVPLSLYLRHLRATLDHEPTLDDLTVETARAWIAHLRATPKRQNQGRAAGERPITLASLHNYVRHLRAFASWLAKPPREYCDASPLTYLKLPRAEEPPKVPVEPDDLARLLARAGQETDTVAGARGKALLLVLVDGGLRAKELINLTLADVSLKEGILLVRRAKGKRPRLVAVGDGTRAALRRYALLRDGRLGATPPADAPFFQTVKGTAFTYFGLRNWLVRLERDTGVRHVHLHLLRHTSAIETLDAGADVRTVQRKLGHADICMTQG